MAELTELEAMQKWAVGMATLLDQIEAAADNEEEVRRLCHQRFALAELCGFRIELIGLAQGGTGIQ